MDVENKDRFKNMIFRYLDELFKNINIVVMVWSEFQIGMIPVDRGKKTTAIQGKVGDSSVYTYFPDNRTISFDRREFRTMVSIFGFDDKEGLNYIKSYFIKNVDGIPDDVVIYIT